MSKTRRAVLQTPNSVAAVETLIAEETGREPAIAARWPQRYLRMTRHPVGLCVRRMAQAASHLDMASIAAIDGSTFTQAPHLAGAIGALMTVRGTTQWNPETDRYDADAPLTGHIAQSVRPGLRVGRLSEAAAVHDTKVYTLRALNTAGLSEAVVESARELARFMLRVRLGTYGTDLRVMTGSWRVAIGHLAMLAHHLYALRHGLAGYDRLRIWDGPVANRPFLDLIEAQTATAEVVPPYLSACENHLSTVPEVIDGELLDHFSACERILARRPPPTGRLLEPAPHHAGMVERLLRSAGLPTDRPFVTLHVREDREEHPDLAMFRNAGVASLHSAIAQLIDAGYSLVRLGDRSMTPLTPATGLFDYALSDAKSPEADIALAAHARFHIGTSSGMSLVPMLFGVPTLFLNWYPIPLIPYGARNHVVLKRLVDLDTGRPLTAAEDYRRVGVMMDATILADAGVRVEEVDARHVTAAVTRFEADVRSGLHGAPAHGQPRIFAPAGDDGFVEFERRDLRIV